MEVSLKVIDYFLIAIVLGGALLAIRRELFINLLKFFRNLLSLFLSIHYHQPLGALLNVDGNVLCDQTVHLLAFLSILISCFFVGSLIIFILRLIVEVKFICILEKVGSVLFGGGHALLYMILFSFIISLIPLPVISDKFFQNSQISREFMTLTIKFYKGSVEKLGISDKFDVSCLNYVVCEISDGPVGEGEEVKKQDSKEEIPKKG